MGSIRLTSLPALPTAPQKYLSFQWPPRMFYYGSSVNHMIFSTPSLEFERKLTPNPRLDKTSLPLLMTKFLFLKV